MSGPISRTGIPAYPSSEEKATQNGVRPFSPGKNVYPTRYETFLASRPRAAEDEAVALMIRLMTEFGSRVHIVHHSSADALPMLRDAKIAGLHITAETCPHYLTFVAEEIPDGATEFKCCPPIREAENRELLWSAVADQTIDMIVSDHSPCPPGMKLRESGDFLAAWGGISSLQLGLPLIWTAARRRGIDLAQVIDWMATGTAELITIGDRGRIAPGLAANLVIFAPDDQLQVDAATLQHRNAITPYQGRTLDGVVRATYLRGERVEAEEPRGNLLSSKRK